MMQQRSEDSIQPGKDGWMAMSLMELGELKLLKSDDVKVWTSTRRLMADGSLIKAKIIRLRKELSNLRDYLSHAPVGS